MTFQTANNIAFLLCDLAQNPDKQRKLYKEINAVVGDSSKVTKDHLKNLSYLKACFKETQRYFSQWIDKECHRRGIQVNDMGHSFIRSSVFITTFSHFILCWTPQFQLWHYILVVHLVKCCSNTSIKDFLKKISLRRFTLRLSHYSCGLYLCSSSQYLNFVF